MAGIERWRRQSAPAGLARPDLTRLLLDDTIRLLDPGTTAELSIPRPRTEEELADLLWRFLGVRIPNVQVCAHHSTPWRAFCDAYFARHPVSIWKGARGLAGKSYTLALLAWVEALTLRADVVILGGSGEQSERVHDYLRGFWMRPGAPAEALASDPSKKRTSLVWGNGITALLASQRSVRGPHPQRLRMDEIDAMDWSILEAALGQPMGRGDVDSQTVLSSTHQNADGPMTKALQMMAERGWSVHEWCIPFDGKISTPFGERTISSLVPGDEVFAYDGTGFVSKRITAAWSNGTKRTVRVVTTAGAIECTAEHKLLTDAGWRAAGTLRPGDQVVLGVWETPVVSGALEAEDGAVPPVLRPAAPPTSRAGDREPVRVWPEEAGHVEDVLGVLPPHVASSEHQPAGRDDAGEGDGKAHALEAGTSGGGTARGARPSVRAAVSDWPVRRGLLPAGSRLRRGSVRRDAPARPELPREGCGAGARGAGGGSQIRGALRPERASVVEVVEGRLVDVWDLSVPDLHNFVASGVVAHNCWRETVEPHGWISQRAVDRKRSEMTAESWRVEVELGEPAPENRAMLQEKVDACFSGEPVSVRNAEYREFEPPVPGAAYATGADWARDVDFTEIVTYRADVFPMRLAAYERLNRRPMPEMVARLDARLRRYPGEAAHDNTGGGNYLADWIEEPVEDVNLVGRQRGELFTNYIAAIEREEIVAPRVEPLYSQHKYCTNDDLFGSGHPPDGVVASALAYRASLSARAPLRMLTGPGEQASRPGAPAAQQPRAAIGTALDYLQRR